MMHQFIHENILYSADKSLLNHQVIHEYLSKESYWAQNIPLEIIQSAINGSECFGAYINNEQIAFARVITDKATFAYLADVFVLEKFRGKGVSKNLMKLIMSYPDFKGLRRFMLATKDAHTLYEQFGFKSLSTPDRFMELKPFENYGKR